jgi:hypothetical protein
MPMLMPMAHRDRRWKNRAKVTLSATPPWCRRRHSMPGTRANSSCGWLIACSRMLSCSKPLDV